MILVDANILIHAYHPRSPLHDEARLWLEKVLSGPGLVRFAWVTLWAFLRISTNARVFEHPLSAEEAAHAVNAWLTRPNAGLVEPGERQPEIVAGLMKSGQATGPLVMDVALAALAIEHGLTLQTTDRDFHRFPGLSFASPLS